MAKKSNQSGRGRKRVKAPPGIRKTTAQAAALAPELAWLGVEQDQLLSAKHCIEKAIQHLLSAGDARRRRHIQPSRPRESLLPSTRQALSDLLSVFTTDDSSLSSATSKRRTTKAIRGAFGPMIALALLCRSLTVREIRSGAHEGAPLPSETLREIFTRLLGEAKVPPTIIAQAMGTRRGSKNHDKALHAVARDLENYEKLLTRDMKTIRARALGDEEAPPGDESLDLLGELPKSVIEMSHHDPKAPELARRQWYERQLKPFSEK